MKRIAGHIRRDVAGAIVDCLEAGVPIAIDDPSAAPPPLPALLDGVAVVLHTSGTTGAPRPVQLSRSALEASAAATWDALGRRAGDRWLCCLSLARIGGLSIVTRSMASECELAFVPRFDVEEVIAAMDRQRVTIVSVVPAMLDMLLSRQPAWRPPAHLRACLVGGAAAPTALLSRARQRSIPIISTYGMTETCSHVALDGVLVRGAAARIESGRIALSGPMLALGCDPWLITGDAGRLDADGRLIVEGRADDAIVSGGETIFPAEVEGALQAAGVRACAFGVGDPRWGEIVAAAVVTAPNQLRDIVKSAGALPSRVRPRLWAAIGQLPLTPAGKLDRKAVARAAASGEFALIR